MKTSENSSCSELKHAANGILSNQERMGLFAVSLAEGLKGKMDDATLSKLLKIFSASLKRFEDDDEWGYL